MRHSILILFLSGLLLPLFGGAQSPAILQSGPMPGFSDMQRVKLWVQTSAEAEVWFGYQLLDGTGPYRHTKSKMTKQQEGFTAELWADSLEKGQVYHYDLFIDGEMVEFSYPTTFQTQPHWQYRSDPPPFRLATGSCAYINEPADDRPGKPYGDGYEIFETLHAKSPDLMIWLGDNVYFREPDWYSRDGMIHRYTHGRSVPEMQALLASTHHYAIWDDHDYGPNDSDRGYFLKDTALEVFDLFWANPTVGIPQAEGAITFFQWNDIDFFLLDNRYNRAPDKRETGERTILGEAQKQWLIDALAFSRAPFKVVAMGGQFLNTAAANETYSNYGYDKERQEIIDLIYAENIKGVIFLSGDRHHSEISVLRKEGSPTIFDVTSSPLTSGVHTGAASEKNDLRVEGSLLMERSFATLDFSGPRTDRRVLITLFGIDGKERFTYTITQADL